MIALPYSLKRVCKVVGWISLWESNGESSGYLRRSQAASSSTNWGSSHDLPTTLRSVLRKHVPAHICSTIYLWPTTPIGPTYDKFHKDSIPHCGR